MIFKVLLLVGIWTNVYAYTDYTSASLATAVGLTLIYIETVMSDLIKFLARTTYGLLRAYHMLDEEEEN